jgi:Phage DNA packaging protein Nu1
MGAAIRGRLRIWMAKHKHQAKKTAAAAAPAVVSAPPVAPSTAWRHVDRGQLAEAMGVHPDTVTDYTRKGMPVITLGGHGKLAVYNLVDCLAWWRERQGKNAKEAAQTRAFNATAELNELKLLREQGELVQRSEVVRDGQSYTRSWANSVRAIARRARQAGIVTTPERETALDGLCRQLLIDISSWKTRGDAERTAKKGVAA